MLLYVWRLPTIISRNITTVLKIAPFCSFGCIFIIVDIELACDYKSSCRRGWHDSHLAQVIHSVTKKDTLVSILLFIKRQWKHQNWKILGKNLGKINGNFVSNYMRGNESSAVVTALSNVHIIFIQHVFQFNFRKQRCCSFPPRIGFFHALCFMMMETNKNQRQKGRNMKNRRYLFK